MAVIKPVSGWDEVEQAAADVARTLPGNELTVAFIAVGSRLQLEAFDADGNPVAEGQALAKSLRAWLKSKDAGELAGVSWAVVKAGPEGTSHEVDRDAFPPQWLVDRCQTFDVGNPVLWLIHETSYEKRRPGEFPLWLQEKLDSLGAWDAERQDVAVDGDKNPLYGPKIFDRKRS